MLLVMWQNRDISADWGTSKATQWNAIICFPIFDQGGAKTGYRKRKELPRKTRNDQEGTYREQFPHITSEKKIPEPAQIIQIFELSI